MAIRGSSLHKSPLLILRHPKTPSQYGFSSISLGPNDALGDEPVDTLGDEQGIHHTLSTLHSCVGGSNFTLPLIF